MSRINLLDKFGLGRVLVIGDVMVDRYLWGEVNKISPEAPVPVVRVREETQVIGGAGNTVANLASLGCPVVLIGVRGKDAAGERLLELLKKSGIESRLLAHGSRKTIVKTRVIAHGQQLIRLDEEELDYFETETAEAVLSLAKDILPDVQVMILSDYGKGLLQTPGLVQALIRLGKQHDIPVLVDPKGKDWERYKGATCVTPNMTELELVAQSTLTGDETTLVGEAQSIRQRYDFSWLLVTRGAKGMCLIGPNGLPLFIAALAREVYDVSGAGDTVIATLAAGVASGLSFPDAARMSNIAASIVVGKLGTQTITQSELQAALQMSGTGGQWNNSSGKIQTLNTAQMLVHAWRADGSKIVFTNGCFDLLHPGHIHCLHHASELGDRLVVGLNADISVRRLKGPNRPILHEQDRAALLAALSCVDVVIIFEKDTPLNLIKALRPDVLVKGADYSVEDVVGREIVEAYGGQIHLIPTLEGYNTSEITNRVMSSRG